MKKKSSYLLSRGFTLIELMIVVAIIGILSAVAVPKFADLLTKSKESSIKNSLGALRSALSIYYSDINEYPSDLTVALTTGQKYFSAIPVVSIPAVAVQSNPGHLSVTGVKNVTAPDDDTVSGVFAYISNGTNGSVYINCIHNDTKGSIWSGY